MKKGYHHGNLRQALVDAASFYLRIEDFKREQVLEAQLLEE